jgi:hypothetical protein
MTSSSNDTDREALHSLLCSVFPFTESDIADRILAEFLPDHDERVKAEAWDEGLLVGQDPYGFFDTTDNPYRRES